MSLRQQAGPGELIAELRMSANAAPGRAWLVVEGPSDSRFWRARLREGCEVVIAGSRNTLLEAQARIPAALKARVAACADADWDRLLGRLRTLPGLHCSSHASRAMTGGLLCAASGRCGAEPRPQIQRSRQIRACGLYIRRPHRRRRKVTGRPFRAHGRG